MSGMANGYHHSDGDTEGIAAISGLLGLLARHHLPPELRFEFDTSARPPIPPVLIPTWPSVHLKGKGDGRDRSSALHKHMIACAPILCPAHDFEVGTVRACKDDVEHLAAYLDLVSRDAVRASYEPVRHVTELTAYMDTYLRRPLNNLLGTLLVHLPLSVYWHASEDGTDWHLVAQPRTTKAQPPPLARLHILWPHWSAHLDQLVTEVSGGAIRMLEERRLGYVRSQRAAVGGDGDAICRLGEHILHQMFVHKMTHYLVTDYRNLVLFAYTPATGPTPLERGTIRVLKRLSCRSTAYHVHSPLALMLATTLYAVHSTGVDISDGWGEAGRGFGLQPPWTTAPESPFATTVDLPPLRAPFEFPPSPAPSLPSLPDPTPPTPILTPPELGNYALTHAWDRGSPPQPHPQPEAPLARTLYGPYTGPVLPHLVVTGGLQFNTVVPHTGVLVSKLDDGRAHGRLWSVGSARLVMRGREWGVVDKSSESYSFGEEEGDVDMEDGATGGRYASWAAARAAIAHEAHTYALLSNLQGQVVPVCHGLFGRLHQDDEIWHMILQDVGRALVIDEMVNPVIQNQIRALYAALHALGIVHGDVRWTHVRRRGTQLRLIDFDRARVRCGEVQWEQLCEAERAEVENMLCNPVESE